MEKLQLFAVGADNGQALDRKEGSEDLLPKEGLSTC